VLPLHGEKRPRVADDRLDLAAMAHDAGVTHEPLGIPSRPACDPPDIEAFERAPVARAHPEDGRPAQSGLRALQHKELEQPALVVQGHPQLPIVVGDVERATRPFTAAFHGLLASGV